MCSLVRSSRFNVVSALEFLFLLFSFVRRTMHTRENTMQQFVLCFTFLPLFLYTTINIHMLIWQHMYEQKSNVSTKASNAMRTFQLFFPFTIFSGKRNVLMQNMSSSLRILYLKHSSSDTHSVSIEAVGCIASA
uniref:Uncharacterized protein n=1 Tax=Amblyomma cajennense TaxID=34607 RepID=A0A023FCL0_AMBCJ